MASERDVCVCVCDCAGVRNRCWTEFSRHSRGDTHAHTKPSNTAIQSKAISLLLIECSGTCMCPCIRAPQIDSHTAPRGDWVTLKGLKESWEEVNDFPTLHPPQKPNKMCQRWEYKISEWEFLLASDIQRNSISGPSVVPRTSRRAGLC